MKRILVRAVVLLVLVVAAGVAYGFLTLVRSKGGLAQWEGTVAAAGLGGEVVVARDANGTPFIRASTEGDLYFAQGFVHAQDRFWQMAVQRQAALGRLSEWLGPLAVNADRVARIWGWRDLARRSFEALPPEDRAVLESYAEGVNAWLQGEAYRRPPEMVILHVDPERWNPQDAFLVAYTMHRTLASPGMEWMRATMEVEGAPALDEAVEMLGDGGMAAPPIIGGGDGGVGDGGSGAVKDRAYSDNWTLSGAHTVTGSPLMANDPQLPLSLPGTWQVQQHTLAERRMAGATLPGVPGIAAGHNGAVAWGITNAQVDVWDLAFLETGPGDPGRYRRAPGESWLEFEERVEVVSVRFGRDRVDTVRTTPTGVAVPSGIPVAPLGDRPGVTLEMRDVAMDLATSAPVAFVHLNRARTVAEGIEALEGVTSPALNLSLADTAGSIGYVMTGRIAVRPRAHATRAALGPTDGNRWEYLEFQDNPRVVDPPSGRIVTANQQIVGDDFPHYLTDMWAPPTRAWRIHELLDARDLHDPASFVEMQTDRLSPVARSLVPLMLASEPASEEDAILTEILEDWDYRFTLDSPAPLVWMTWVSALRGSMLDEPGSLPDRWSSLLYAPLIRALSGERSSWCDDLATGEAESCADILTASLTEARLALEESFGPEPDDWRWGEAARFEIPHLGFADLPVLGSRFSRSTPIPGGPESLFTNAALSGRAPRFSSTLFNSSYQGVYDLSDLSASLFMTAGGPSGHYASPFYNNLTAPWIAGARFRLDPDGLAPVTSLTLTPE